MQNNGFNIQVQALPYAPPYALRQHVQLTATMSVPTRGSTAVATYRASRVPRKRGASVCMYMRRVMHRPQYSRFLSPSGNHLFLPLSDLKGEGADKASASAIFPINKLLMRKETDRRGQQQVESSIERRSSLKSAICPRGFRTTSKISTAGTPAVILVQFWTKNMTLINTMFFDFGYTSTSSKCTAAAVC